MPTAYGMPCGPAIGDYMGTLGFPARDRRTGAAVAVTASHVVTRFGRLPPGTLVYADGVGLIGAVCRDAAPAMDAACVTLLPGVVEPVWRWPGGEPEVWPYGGVVPHQPAKDAFVWKAGKTTGGTCGQVLAHGLTVAADVRDDGTEWFFEGASVVYPWWPPAFARPGDSGSVVVDAFGRVVGLVFAVTKARACYYHPADAVLKALDLVPW